MAVVKSSSRQISINSFIAVIAALVVGLFVSPANADRVTYNLGDDIPATITGDATSGDLELNAVNGEIIYTGSVNDVSSSVPTNLYATGTWGSDSGARVNLRGGFSYTGVSTVDCYVLVFKGNGSNTSITSAGFAGNGKIAIEGVNGTNNRNMTLNFTADPSTPQALTGVVQINGATRLILPTDANLGKSTLRMIGGSSSYYTELTFSGVAKTVTFNDVTSNNGYARVMNLNDSIAADDLNTISLKSGTFTGEMGRYAMSSDLSSTRFVNYFNLTKASDGTENGGTLTLSGPVYYKGKTTIDGGTLVVSNSDFVSTSDLVGSGTLKLSGNNKYFNIASDTPSDFTGTIQIADSSISGNVRIKLAAATYSWSNNALQTTYSATDVNLPKATLLLDGNTSGKYAEFAFQYKDSDLTIGTLQGNGYARVLNTDGNTTSATYCTLTVGNGNYAGEIGRRENENLYPFTNYINLVKADDGSADGGTLTLSNDYMLYVGTTTIEGGTLEITNTNSSDGYRQIFTRSTALNGSGTLDFTGKGWTVFSINTADTTTPQEFTGTVNVAENSKIMIKSEGSPVKDLNLGNATLHLDKNANVGLHGNGGVASALTVKELNTETGSTVRVCSASPNAGNYGVLTVGKGTVNGNIGVADDNYYNMVSLVKASDGSADGGTLTIKGNLYYTGPTVIDGGTLRFENNTGNYKYFQRSTALNGSGTLELEGNGWIGFAVNASADSPQAFTGSVDVLSNAMIRTSSGPKPLNLGNGTINVAENVILGMHVDNGAISNLTVKELNTETGSTVRLCSNNPGANNYGTLTVGSGTVNGNLGEANNTNTWYNWVNLVKVSDGTLTLSGTNLYTGTIDVQAGVLKLTDDATLSKGATTIREAGTLEFEVADGDEKQVAITTANPISGAGKIVKSGSGTLTIDNADAPSTISADLFTVEAGELDFAGDFNGAMVIGADGVLSPGDSIGTLSVTGNVTVADGGIVLFEFGSFESGEYDQLILGDGAAFTAGASSIELSFLNGDEEDWATSDIQLISSANFIGDISLTDDFGGLFALENRDGGLYLVAGAPGPGPGPEPGSGVPEPSTWALLLLGAAGLMYWRKKNA
ncbi:MAG: autotransporter-associated beta strand repeat-containing protein [Thermoguttaceae bacterium]|nr:autotransporter-associated beta strand repeat-containing protein [Thermoguttaceae bacterium]